MSVAALEHPSPGWAGRTYEAGKRFGLRDAFQALFFILRYWLKD